MWEGEEPQQQEGGPTPKQRLLNWINTKVPDLPIKNFTTDWNDGKAIGALVDAVAPGLYINEPRHEIYNNVAFCQVWTPNKPVQPPFKFNYSK